MERHLSVLGGAGGAKRDLVAFVHLIDHAGQLPVLGGDAVSHQALAGGNVVSRLHDARRNARRLDALDNGTLERLDVLLRILHDADEHALALGRRNGHRVGGRLRGLGLSGAFGHGGIDFFFAAEIH